MDFMPQEIEQRFNNLENKIRDLQLLIGNIIPRLRDVERGSRRIGPSELDQLTPIVPEHVMKSIVEKFQTTDD